MPKIYRSHDIYISIITWPTLIIILPMFFIPPNCDTCKTLVLCLHYLIDLAESFYLKFYIILFYFKKKYQKLKNTFS